MLQKMIYTNLKFTTMNVKEQIKALEAIRDVLVSIENNTYICHIAEHLKYIDYGNIDSFKYVIPILYNTLCRMRRRLNGRYMNTIILTCNDSYSRITILNNLIDELESYSFIRRCVYRLFRI